jgi:Tol biopolymer transport system component
MRRIGFFALCVLLLTVGFTRAQDGMDLPTPLYLLTNNGQVQRIGLGTEGISVVTPTDAFVVDFGVAPDGNWLAYRTEKGLYMLNMYTKEAATIEEGTADIPPSRGHGDTLAWSPTGDMLVYTTSYGARVYTNTPNTPTFADIREGVFVNLQWSPTGAYLAAEAEGNIWWIYRRENNALILTSAITSSIGLAWVSNTELDFAPADGGLIRMNLAAGNAQTILLDNSWRYSLPIIQPDGTLVVFGAQKTDKDVPEGSGRLISLSPNTPRSSALTKTVMELNGLQWAPTGKLILALRGGVLAMILPETGEGFPLPFADVVAYSWGPMPIDSVNGLALTFAGAFIAADGNNVQQVWRLPGDNTPPVQVTQATKDVTAYVVSPDKQTVAFISDGKLWSQGFITTSDPKTLADKAAFATDLTYNPNGRQIAYTLPNSDGVQGGIWLVSTKGGDAKVILAHGAPNNPPQSAFSQPVFAPNINGLLVTRTAPNYPEALLLIDLNTLEAQEIGVASKAIWLQSGFVLAYNSGLGYGANTDDQIIYRIDPAHPAEAAKIATIPQPARIVTMQDIVAVRARLILGTSLIGPRALNVADMLTTTGAISAVGSAGFMVMPTISPDGRYVAGQTHEGGALTVRDMQTGKQVVLAAPPQISGFSWVY